MATKTETLSADVLAVMDRAVRAARNNGWCDRFSSICADVFGVPAENVVDSDGIDCEGWSSDGYNKEGFDRDGRDRDGYDYNGRDEDGYNRAGFDRYGFNKDGLDDQGRDKWKYDRDGYDRDGYNYCNNRKGANKDWYDKHAAKPDTDFVYDMNGFQRPTKTDEPKKNTKAKASKSN